MDFPSNFTHSEHLHKVEKCMAKNNLQHDRKKTMIPIDLNEIIKTVVLKRTV
jgi:hypothetical protein